MTGVLIVSDHPLFGEGLENLLRGQPGIAVLAVEGDMRRLVERIDELRPDVVLVGCGSEGSDPMPLLTGLLHLHAGVRVISVNLRDSCMCIHSSQQRVARAADDLIEAIRS